MILNNEGIVDAINSREFEITEFMWDNKLESKAFDTSSLKDGHKIRLHVGYLIRTLSDKRWINPKALYHKRDGIIDLRKLSEHQYILKPGESVILFTNEAIKMGPNIFGLLLSRVSLEENGLIVSPSYIDPNWNGLIQLVVTNNSETEQILQEHCEIANLILLKMNKPTTVTTIPKNGHFAVTWESIKDNPRLPTWNDRKRKVPQKIQHAIHTYWYIFTGIGLVGTIGILYYLITISISLYNFIIQTIQ